MASKQQGKGISLEESLMLFLGLFAILIIAMWYFHHDGFVRSVLHYCYYLGYLPAYLSKLLGFNNAFPLQLEYEIAKMSFDLGSIKAIELFKALYLSSFYLVPLIIPVFFWAKRVNNDIIKNFEKLHTHWTLMVKQSETNPCIIPVVRFTEFWEKRNLPRHESLFRALTPDEFAEKHELIIKKPHEYLLDFDKTEQVFIKQIGKRLSFKEMEGYKKALAVIFMTRIVYRGAEGRKKAKDMQDAINRSCDPLKVKDNNYRLAFDFSCANKFNELVKDERIKNIARFFVHEKTFLMRLLNESRHDGKLTPSEFIWLKLIDRELWYALYGVSKTLIAKGYPEGAGPFGQYWAAILAMENDQVLTDCYTEETIRGFEKRLYEANMLSERKKMTEREKLREAEFGKIPIDAS